MTVGQLRIAGTLGVVSVISFMAAFLLDPLPPTAGANAGTVLDHMATTGGADRAAAFLLGVSAAALVPFFAGVRAWFEGISGAPRWWGAAMFGGALVTATSLLVTSSLLFLLSTHSPPNGDIGTYLNDGVNYGFVFTGFGVIVTVGSLAALMLATGGPLALLGRLGAVVTLLQLPFLATAFFSSGPLVAGGGATIAGFAATAVFLILTAVSVLWFARLMAASQR